MLDETKIRECLLGWLDKRHQAGKFSQDEMKAIQARLKAFVPVPAAIAYLRDGQIYLHTWSQVWDGLRYLSEPVFVLDPTDQAELGRKVLESLESYTIVEEMPPTFAGVTRPLQKAAKVRSERAFFSVPHKRLQIEFKEGCVVLTPHKAFGKEYKLQETKVRQCSLVPQEIGRALSEALESAEWSS